MITFIPMTTSCTLASPSARARGDRAWTPHKLEAGHVRGPTITPAHSASENRLFVASTIFCKCTDFSNHCSPILAIDTRIRCHPGRSKPITHLGPHRNRLVKSPNTPFPSHMQPVTRFRLVGSVFQLQTSLIRFLPNLGCLLTG